MSKSTTRKTVRRIVRRTLQSPGAFIARMRSKTKHAPRFYGAFPSRELALCSMPDDNRQGYDNAQIADVSFAQMCQREGWDYPLIFWLERLLTGCATLIDAGGHMGTKYIAFSDVIDLSRVQWTVFDLPGIITAAKQRQMNGDIPAAVQFEDRIAALQPSDLLMASGLLQYLDIPFADFVGALPKRPQHILLNKVALRDGPAIFTVERIGTGRVVYQIRERAVWEREITEIGYAVTDSWNIDNLGHVIPTHPWLGQSESKGYLLTLRETAI